MTSDAPILEVRGLSKRFGQITAVDDVSLSIGRGEVLAIVGDNGAGKTTLVKMMAGAVRPDSGQVLVDGRAVRMRSPLEARRFGVEMLYQDLALLPNLDVTTNLFLGREYVLPGPLGVLGFIARRRMRREAHSHLSDLRINIPRLWGTPVASLSGGQRQSVAIAKAMMWASKLVIMDEPTAALGVAQSQAVLDLVKRVRERGTSVVIISHILPHVLDIADRVMVLRHGQKVAEAAASDLSQDRLIQLIVGTVAAA